MKRRTTWLLVCALAVALVVGIAVVRYVYLRPHTITADFTSATGLYPGDDVRIAGVKVGTIRSITPEPDRVRVALDIDRRVRVPADAKAVIVAANLVAARFIQLAPLYQAGQPQLADGATIPSARTAVPVEWDEVKSQLSRLATELGPNAELSSSSVGRFIDTAANAMNGNGDKLRQTFAQLSQLARILADGSGDIVATIKNLQTFVTALRDSNDDIVMFEDRLASFSSVLADSRSDLDAALSEVAIAVGEVRRFVAGTRDKTADQVQRLAEVTQVLADHHTDLEGILHVAPTAFANSYNIINPNVPGALGTFVLANFSNPVMFLCGAIGGIENVTAPETAKLCAQYLGPAMRLMNFNFLPQPPLNPFLMPAISPDKITYADPALAPGGSGGQPRPPEDPPALSAYGGGAAVDPGPAQPPGLTGLLLPAETPAAQTGSPQPTEGTPPA